MLHIRLTNAADGGRILIMYVADVAQASVQNVYPILLPAN